MDQETAAPADKPVATIPVKVHVMCGWPLLLLFFGGAVGGGLGGLAYGINLSIYKSRLPAYAKIILNPMVGVAAFLIWLMIVVAIQLARE